MANNRLYIVDIETGEKFMLCKTMGRGWYCRETNPGEDPIEKRLEDWLDNRDRGASYGNCFGGVTSLRLTTEAEFPSG